MTVKPNLECLVISDFNAANFAAYLRNDTSPPVLKVTLAEYGQVQQTLLQDDLDCWKDRPDVAVVWTCPGKVIETFRRVEEGEPVSVDDLLSEVDAYCAALAAAAARTDVMLVPAWVQPYTSRAYSLLDMKTGAGAGNSLLRMNLRLVEKLESVSNIHVLNAGKWIERAGEGAFSDELWYLAKVPFSNDVCKSAAGEVKSSLRALRGDVKKRVVLDLDDTLWGGIVGDVGWEKIVLGGHDHVGEAFVDFQRELKSLKKRGMLLAIVSKNEESIALEAIRRHPEMVLREEDFAGWRINWGDKAQNLVDLVSDLNLGLQSVVFIDDSPAERARVAEALPEVFVPEWPRDKTRYKRALLGLDCLNAASLSAEDRERTASYRAEMRRDDLRQAVGSFDDWLKGLGVTVTVRDLEEENLPRAAQLLNKTNQMNLGTRRMTEKELRDWAAEASRRFWTLHVSDRFGEYGLTGLLSVEEEGDTANIVDFVLSCRVIGRRVEETMMHLAIDFARRKGLRSVSAHFKPTARNKPCRDFLERSGFDRAGDEDVFAWDASVEYPAPDGVSIAVLGE